ncbi:hypothetical protein B0A55_03031 [Friedmanniomyces simplex]|uniref:C3H1-type domain-containing protein n=1 Tax=Friedmanniomyces simplex TaxID=329884 RepID=A0A4U0XYM3_9PEZI|nr:hypothetical protein B0A55_03031 [Friedmanniomyces simplex]
MGQQQRAVAANPAFRAPKRQRIGGVPSYDEPRLRYESPYGIRYRREGDAERLLAERIPPSSREEEARITQMRLQRERDELAYEVEKAKRRNEELERGKQDLERSKRELERSKQELEAEARRDIERAYRINKRKLHEMETIRKEDVEKIATYAYKLFRQTHDRPILPMPGRRFHGEPVEAFPPMHGTIGLPAPSLSGDAEALLAPPRTRSSSQQTRTSDYYRAGDGAELVGRMGSHVLTRDPSGDQCWDNRSRAACKFFGTKRGCKKGDRCTFYHPPARLPRHEPDAERKSAYGQGSGVEERGSGGVMKEEQAGVKEEQEIKEEMIKEEQEANKEEQVVIKQEPEDEFDPSLNSTTPTRANAGNGATTQALITAALAVAKAWQILTRAAQDGAAAIIKSAGEEAFGAEVFGEALVEAVKHAK